MPKPNNRYGELSTSQQSDVDAYINAVASGRRSGRPLTGCMVQRLSTSLQTLTHIRAMVDISKELTKERGELRCDLEWTQLSSAR